MLPSPDQIRSIVIVGGGTAGWMSAAALANGLKGLDVAITLIESDQIGTIGVGEATIPAIHAFNSILGIDQADFLRACNATFKLGIEFVDWGRKDQSYIHPFSAYGRDHLNLAFHQMWLRHAAERLARGENDAIEDYNICCAAARSGKFSHPISGKDIGVSPLNYAFQFDASLYAKYLRGYAEARGVVRVEGKIVDATQDTNTGHIGQVRLEDGRQFGADLFLDCSGLQGLLIERVLKTGYDDWRHWLPCDRAIAVPCTNIEPPCPYTRSTADDAGWRWRIPLQHRVGNGYVYASPFITDDAAEARLMSTIDGEATAPPRRIKFVPGRRKAFWVGNCVAIGLAAGFLEPLESTAIHLIQTAIVKLLALFPDRRFNQLEIDHFNQLTEREYEEIRDFLLLHYKATTRDDTPFWDHCREIEIPAALQTQIDLFKSHGRMFIPAGNLFSPPSWLAVMVGQGLVPESPDPLSARLSGIELDQYMNHIKAVVVRNVQAMPSHSDYLQNFCPSRAAS